MHPPMLIFILASLLLVSSDGKTTTKTAATDSDNDDAGSVCQNLLEGNENNNMSVLTIGLLSKSLIIITTNYFVFDLAPDAMRGAINSSTLYLGFKKPVPLAVKWPNLANNKDFKEITTKKLVFNSFTVSDADDEFLLFITRLEKRPGVQFNINEERVTGREWYYNGTEKNANLVMISATKRMQFYGLQEHSGYIEISEWKFNGKKIDYSDHMTNVSAWLRICSKSAGTVFFAKPSDAQEQFCKKERTLKNVLKGFIDADQMVLLGSVYIYTFKLEALSKPGMEVTLGKQRYKDFMVCQPDMLKYALIGLGALLLLLLLLLLLWFCLCRKKRKDKNAEKKLASSKKKVPTKSKKSKGSKKSRSTGKKSNYGSNKGDPTKRSKMKTRSKKKKSKKKLSKMPRSKADAVHTRRSVISKKH